MTEMVTNERSLAIKRAHLYTFLQGCGRLLVAYSGGVDSAYLAWAAHQILGDKMQAVIADSPSLSRTGLREAEEFAALHAIPLRKIATSELSDPAYVRNDAMRCFHCKDAMFRLLDELAAKEGFNAVAYGVNADDQGDWRPGQQAASNHHVAAPLLEAGLGKQEIRELARLAGLALWNKPASACLASRIEYNRPVTVEALAQVEAAEEYLRSLGLRQLRVRHHGELARLEIAREEMAPLLNVERFAEIAAHLKQIGFKFVALDLEGFRSGSMNDLLPAEKIGRAG
jgi:uncharacterized protein